MRRISRGFSRICLGLLGVVLGAGCNDIIDQPAEYGMPHARYKLDGTVRSAATSESIEGIRVALTHEGSAQRGDSTLTAADGTWALDVTDLPCDGSCVLLFSDVDGAAGGGAFQSAGTTIAPTQSEPGNSRWDYGTFEQHDIEVDLTPEETRP